MFTTKKDISVSFNIIYLEHPFYFYRILVEICHNVVYNNL